MGGLTGVYLSDLGRVLVHKGHGDPVRWLFAAAPNCFFVALEGFAGIAPKHPIAVPYFDAVSRYGRSAGPGFSRKNGRLLLLVATTSSTVGDGGICSIIVIVTDIIVPLDAEGLLAGDHFVQDNLVIAHGATFLDEFGDKGDRRL